MGGGVHIWELDDGDQGGSIVGDLGQGVEVDGLVHADENEVVLEDTQVGGSMRIFNRGLALQNVFVLNLQHIIINPPKNTHHRLIFYPSQVNIQENTYR